MKHIAEYACAAVMAAGLVAAGSPALAQDARSGDKTLKVAPVDAKASMDSLMEAVKQLREASVLLVNQKAPGAKREKAFKAAQDAVIQTQRAMALLPAEVRVRGTEMREAKDWPVIAARLDEASQELESAVKQVSEADAGKKRDQAISSMRKAMNKVNDALAAIPEREIGDAQSGKK